jgi:hypothetical protein
LYALNIGQRLLLMILIDRQAYSSRLGSVWYYARQAAVNLRETLGKNEVPATPEIFMEEEIDQAFADELDKLLMGEPDKPSAPATAVALPPVPGPPVARPAKQPQAAPRSDAPQAGAPAPRSGAPAPRSGAPAPQAGSNIQLEDFDFSQDLPDLDLELDDENMDDSALFSFEEALAQQLIPQDLWRKQS